MSTLLTVVTARAQTTTSNVIIKMDEPCNSSAPSKMFVVLTSDQSTQIFTVSRVEDGGDWTGKPPLTFIAEHAVARLQYPGVGTDCESVSETKMREAYFAIFRFDCNQQAVVDIDVTNSRSLKMIYRRELSTSCAYDKDFTAGANVHPLSALRVSGETFTVQFGISSWNFAKPGFLVLSSGKSGIPLLLPDPDDPKALKPNPKFNNVVDRKAAKCRTTGDRVCLTSAQAALVLAKQNPLQIGPNSIANDRKNLEDAGLNDFTLAVK